MSRIQAIVLCILVMVLFGAEAGAAEAPFVRMYGSSLSPFVVVQHDGKRLVLFKGIEAQGLGGPKFVALRDDHKSRVAEMDGAIDPAGMSESWMVFWFNGASGWDKVKQAPYPIDLPMLVVLQKKPTAIKPAGGGGIEMTFPEEAGYVAMSPLYGLSLIRQTQTAEWKKAFPDEVMQRCRTLAEVSREFPVEVDERFKVNPRLDRVLVRDRFEFMSIDDEWATPHRKIAPLEYKVALAQRAGLRLLSVTGKVVDLDYPAGGGAFAGVEGEEYAYTLTGFLRYINTVEQPKSIPADDPLLPEARKNFNWRIMRSRDIQNVPYADAAEQAKLRADLFDKIGFASNVGIQWKYWTTAVTGDRQRLCEAWKSVLRRPNRGLRADYSRGYMSFAAQADREDWQSYFRPGTWDAEVTAGTEDAIAFARLAFWAGDQEMYRFASNAAARRLLSLWAVGMARPKWAAEKGLWSEAESVPKSLSEPEVRFIKDRMLEYGKRVLAQEPNLRGIGLTDEEGRDVPSLLDARDSILDIPLPQRRQNRTKYYETHSDRLSHEFEIIRAGLEQKYAPLWTAKDAPRADNMFQRYLSQRQGEYGAQSSVWRADDVLEYGLASSVLGVHEDRPPDISNELTWSGLPEKAVRLGSVSAE